MINIKLILLFAIFSITSLTVFSQNCNCDYFPVKAECKEKCFQILQIGTSEQITQKVKVSPETAKKIVSTPNRMLLK